MPSRFMEAKFFSTRRFNWNLKSIDNTIIYIIHIGLDITFVDIRIVITFSICDSERLAGGVITWVRYNCQVSGSQVIELTGFENFCGGECFGQCFVWFTTNMTLYVWILGFHSFQLCLSVPSDNKDRRSTFWVFWFVCLFHSDFFYFQPLQWL